MTEPRLYVEIMTLFPNMFYETLGKSILGRAQDKGIISIRYHQIRDYTSQKQNQVDDYPYGGGHGAILQADPLYRCWEEICDLSASPVYTVFLSPSGHQLTESDAKRLRNVEHLVLVCGHYEGIDERFVEECVDEEISIGDYVLTGGELPAMVLTDAVCRLVPGVLSDSECYEDESYWSGMLEYPQYSRPEIWHDMAVPSVLLSGHHGNVAQWRKKQSILRTQKRRPDLYSRLDLSGKEDRKLLKEIEEEFEKNE